MQALAPDPEKRIPSLEALEGELQGWLESAEAAGWGEMPLPGFVQATEESTVAGTSQTASPESRLGPYLDGLASGPVGPRRAAAEGLVRSAREGDEGFLLEALEKAPETSRFALCQALGKVGGEASLARLLELVGDPFARGEAAEAAASVAMRIGQGNVVLARLGDNGLGEPWRWAPRARLGDETWGAAIGMEWEQLPPTQRVQALEAAALAPEPLRRQIKTALKDRVGSMALQRLVDSL